MRNHLVFWVNGRRHEVRGEAAERAARAGEGESLANRYPAAAWNDAGLGLRREPLDLMAEGTAGPLRVTSPVGLEEAVAIRAGGDARVIAGGTDLGVLWNKRKLRPRHWLDLSRIESLRTVRVTHTGGQPVLEAGPLATWTDLIEVCRTWCRPAVAVLESFGGPQIRHVGTLGGNIVNGSPIADRRLAAAPLRDGGHARVRGARGLPDGADRSLLSRLQAARSRPRCIAHGGAAAATRGR